MTTLLFARRALADVDRLTDFLLEKMPGEAAKTPRVLRDGLALLESHPGIGRPVGRGLRELVISRGATGYVALYKSDPQADAVLVLAIRHQREAGYSGLP